MASKRSVMRIQLDGTSKDRLEVICKKRGMTQIAVMSRLVNWFSVQDDYVQTAVLQALSEGSMATLAKSFMKKLSSEDSHRSGSGG